LRISLPHRETLWLPALALLAFGASVAGSYHLDDYSLLSQPILTPNRPLASLTLMASHALGGGRPWAHHLLNLALHLAAACLAYQALRRLIPAPSAWLGAALFAVHPMQAEAVNYIFARSVLLGAVCCLAALERWAAGRHWHAVGWFVAALLSREDVVAFPVFLAMLHLAISRNRTEWRPIGAMAALAAAAGAYGVWLTAVIPGSGAGAQSGIAPLDYLATQGAVIWRYLKLFLIPWGFTIEPDFVVTRQWLGWLGLCVTCGIASRWWSKARAGFWFCAGLLLLLPSSSVVPVADLSADRRMYLPMLAFCAAAGLLLVRLPGWSRGVLLTALCLLSIGRTGVWLTEESLWREAVRLAPGRVRPRIQLARAVRPEEALRLLEEARVLAPEDAVVAAEFGRVYMTVGQPAQALAWFGRALALRPNDARAFNNRGAALAAMGQHEAARADFERALAVAPCFAEALDNLARMGVGPPAGCATSRR